MSRIEEALRRAAAATGRGALDEGIVVRPEHTRLEEYPRERPAPAAEELIAPRPARAATSSRMRAGVGRVGLADEEFNSKLVLGSHAPIVVEQYRRLAASLHELQQQHRIKTLMVASAVPREGKTLTVTNLALTFSESYGRRVLLIDADLRRPSIHRVLGLPNTTGLAEGLRHEAGDLSLVQVSTNLTVLTAGRPDSNPMAGLTSERMRKLLEDAASAFDWILLDAPPVGLMPDANLLAGLTHGVILVIAAGTTPYPLVARAINEIGQDHIVGTVLNRVSSESIPSTQYYSHYYVTDGRQAR
jgi:capsular exopolysaccharide synthesis family protein